jgi:hypothetical protein
MAIVFSCECGKQMQAKEEFAGRRMKCPVCQRVVTIPGPANPREIQIEIPPAVMAAEEPPTVGLPPPLPVQVPAAAGPPIRFSCTCGKQLQADAGKVGRALRCPSCGAMVTVPPESVVPLVARRAVPPVKPLAEGWLEQRITPWRADDAARFGARDWEHRDRRSNRGVSEFLALLVVLAVGATALAYQDDIRERLNLQTPAAHHRASVGPANSPPRRPLPPPIKPPRRPSTRQQ